MIFLTHVRFFGVSANVGIAVEPAIEGRQAGLRSVQLGELHEAVGPHGGADPQRR